MFLNIAVYLLIGMIWAEWLEWFCMKNFTGTLGKPFGIKEKWTQLLLWPIFVLIFVYNFLDDVFKRL